MGQVNYESAQRKRGNEQEKKQHVPNEGFEILPLIFPYFVAPPSPLRRDDRVANDRIAFYLCLHLTRVRNARGSLFPGSGGFYLALTLFCHFTRPMLLRQSEIAGEMYASLIAASIQIDVALMEDGQAANIVRINIR